MGFFKDIREIRGALDKAKLEQDGDMGSALLNALLGRTVTITEEQALNVPTVAGCVEFITNQVAALPVRLYKRENGDVHEIKDDPRTHLLNNDTGDILSGWQWKKAMARDYLLHGAGYSYIRRSRNDVKSLHYVKNQNVSVTAGADPINKTTQILVAGQRYREFDFLSVTRNTNDGVKGSGILKENARMLAMAYALLTFEYTQIKSGGSKKGFLKSENRLGRDAFNELKENVRSMYTNEDFSMVLLNKGLNFEDISLNAVELQLNERKTTSALEIYRIFTLTPEALAGKAGDEAYIHAIKTAVLPVVDAFTSSLNKDLLLESEKGVFFFAFDTRDSLKGDTLKRYQAYAEAIKANVMQIDEVRELENLPPLGLDFIKLGLQDVLYDPKTKTVFVPNTGMANKMDEKPAQIGTQRPPEGGEEVGDRDQK